MIAVAVSPHKTRADSLSVLLTFAFDELLWISEYPNRTSHRMQDATVLATRARQALARIEREDPEAMR